MTSTISFSTFGILSGGKLDVAETPAQVVASIPFEHCWAYVLPENTTYSDFCGTLTDAGVGDVGLFHVQVNETMGIALVGVQSTEELAALKTASITVNGKQVVASGVIAFDDRLLSVCISGLEATSYEEATRNIYQALHPHGNILDITFAQTGITTDSRATVIINPHSDVFFPELLRIGRNKATLTSSQINEDDCTI
ncbi:hypothetical protein FBU31_001577 [Coemansia sp. 'formosensis']|nr:hypothetical protein FBU31_001577 [Coemansia sp. 'formosensis']